MSKEEADEGGAVVLRVFVVQLDQRSCVLRSEHACVCVHAALHAASLSGHVSTVKLLLERGAMVDSLDVMKHTPLFRACEMGHRDVILTLIKGVVDTYIICRFYTGVLVSKLQ